MHVCAPVYMWRSEANVRKSSSSTMPPEDGT